MTSTGEDLLRTFLSGSTSMLETEKIAMEAIRDLLKDEVKKRIRAKLDADPELREELKDALEALAEAKIRETYAMLRLAKCGAKLSLEMVPKHLQEEISNEIASTLEREFSRLLGEQK